MAPATFKIFVRNVDESVNSDELTALFEQYGGVIYCAIVKNYAFVHMQTQQQRELAMKKLNGTLLKGKALIVEEGKTDVNATKKFFVGNLPDDTSTTVVRQLFEKYGNVIECDVVRNYAFVHLECNLEIMREVLRELNGVRVEDKPIIVQMSISRVRSKPGMGDPEKCFRCGLTGHWSKQCPQWFLEQMAFYGINNGLYGMPAASFMGQRSATDSLAIVPYSYGGSMYFRHAVVQHSMDSYNRPTAAVTASAGSRQRANYRTASIGPQREPANNFMPVNNGRLLRYNLPEQRKNTKWNNTPAHQVPQNKDNARA